METITFEIRLINREKRQGMNEYKRGWKPPMALRRSQEDHLNVFRKEVDIAANHQANEKWGKEIQRLQEETNWQIKKYPDFGDTLIGNITIMEFSGDFYREIYKAK